LTYYIYIPQLSISQFFNNTYFLRKMSKSKSFAQNALYLTVNLRLHSWNLRSFVATSKSLWCILTG